MCKKNGILHIKCNYFDEKSLFLENGFIIVHQYGIYGYNDTERMGQGSRRGRI